MKPIAPKLVCLDSSTWGLLAKDIAHDDGARRLLSLLNAGEIIPFFTSHHLDEIMQHEDDGVFMSRIALIRSLKFAAFHRLKEEKANVGNMLELRELEILELLKNPTIPFDELRIKVREKLCNGFVSGQELCSMNEEWWAVYRKEFAPYMRAHAAEIASIAQIPMANLKEKIPAPGSIKLRPRNEIIKNLISATNAVTKQLEDIGDDIIRNPLKRLESPENVSKRFHAELWEENISLSSTEDPFEQMLHHYGVKRYRLPKNATIEDLGDEAIFAKTMRKHEQRLHLPEHAVASICQNEIPSWVVWREVNRAMRSNLKMAEGSSLIDKMIAPFGLYLDGLEMDKRGVHAIKQASLKHWLLKFLQPRVFRRKNWKVLINILERMRE